MDKQNGKGHPTPKAPQNQPAPVQIPLVRTIAHHAFNIDIQPLPDGGAQIAFLIPTGEALVFPLNQETAKHIGEKLIAPRVEVPSGVLN